MTPNRKLDIVSNSAHETPKLGSTIVPPAPRMLTTATLLISLCALSSITSDTKPVKASRASSQNHWVASPNNNEPARPVSDGATPCAVNVTCQPPLDFGDAPITYNTLRAHDGARHEDIGPKLGQTRDLEMDGTPSPLADGDGLDEDGIQFQPFANNPPILSPCRGNPIQVTVTGGDGYLHAWLDSNANGVWDASEKLSSFNGRHVFAGPPETVFVDLPCDIPSTDQTYMRFRLVSHNGNVQTTGHQASGEVEDYMVRIWKLDYGDAPSGYPVTAQENGARHKLPDLYPDLEFNYDANNDPAPDHEINGQHDNDSLADDHNLLNDERGVIRRTSFVSCAPGAISARSVGEPGKINMWVDINGDHDWDDTNEHIAQSLPVPPLQGPACFGNPFQCENVVEFYMGTDELCSQMQQGTDVTDKAVVRARIAGDDVGPTGTADGGEIEDHIFDVFQRDTIGCLTGGDKPVIMLHGFMTPASANCEQSFSAVTSDFASWGWPSQWMDWIKFYSQDEASCKVNSLNYSAGSGQSGAADHGTSIRQLAYHVAWYIYKTYNVPTIDHPVQQTLHAPTAVDVLAHSMGGLVIRYALAARQYQAQYPNLVSESMLRMPSGLNVEDVFTGGTPHKGLMANGAQLGTLGIISPCWFTGIVYVSDLTLTQCSEQKAGSTLMQFLAKNQYGRNPQGSNGTQWTVSGSTEDQLIHPKSAIGMDGNHVRQAVYDGERHLRHVGTQHNIKHMPWDDSYPNIYYFLDRGCTHHMVMRTNDCKTYGDTGEGFRCALNKIDQNERSFPNLCLWQWQPNVNYHASLALSKSEW